MNPQDLQRYKTTLLDMRSRSRAEIHRMVEIVLDGAQAAGEHDWQVSEAVDKELSLGHTEEMIHRAVVDALQRIEDGTFGQCRKCGKPIPAARLDAIPFTPYCVHCERQIEVQNDGADTLTG
jgi:RNA polymerase-binding transcription factor DksA